MGDWIEDDGIITVPVKFSAAEWRRLQKEHPTALTGEGTPSASVRKALGLWEVPRRTFKKPEQHVKGPRAMLPIRKGPGVGTDTSKRRSLR